MGRVLVTEKLADAGLDLLAGAGHEVDVQLDLSADDLALAIRGADALIIRSATSVTAELLAAGDRLKVVGRAGVGLDNVDTAAATELGVIVANAPTSNSISAAEHTMALILASARNVPQAHTALKVGRWERAKWKGVELNEKTLGIVGLGNIGALVAQRARSFGMRLIGHDPFVQEGRAAELGVELLELDDVVAQSDFLTLHLARTPETIDLIDGERLRLAKPDLRVINVARGGIINEDDLASAIVRGVVGGAAIDVFDSEPKTESPLFGLDRVVVTPHLGASTSEAQDRAGATIAEQVILALAGDFVPFAVNVSARGVSEEVRPFLPLAEQLGARFARLVGDCPGSVDVVFAGEIGGFDCRMAELAITKGLMSELVDSPVSYVNAEEVASEAGLKIEFRSSTRNPSGFVSGISIEGGSHSLAGTILVPSGEMRLVSLDGITVDIPPAEHLTVVANTDQPGMIGAVTTALGNAGINIDDMHIGRLPGENQALMVIATATAIPAALLAGIAATDGITAVRSLDLTG